MDLTKNRRGQTVFIGIMIAIMVFITVVVLIDPLKDMIIWTRLPSNLDCTNSSITAGQKATCIIVDFTLFYYVGMGIAAGAAYISWKKLKKPNVTP